MSKTHPCPLEKVDQKIREAAVNSNYNVSEEEMLFFPIVNTDVVTYVVLTWEPEEGTRWEHEVLRLISYNDNYDDYPTVTIIQGCPANTPEQEPYK
jgi:hypothetical protein